MVFRGALQCFAVFRGVSRRLAMFRDVLWCCAGVGDALCCVWGIFAFGGYICVGIGKRAEGGLRLVEFFGGLRAACSRVFIVGVRLR